MISRWLVTAVRVPSEPSRHRVGVWRELRRIGAVTLGAGVWAVPAAPAFTPGMERVTELVDAAGGTVITLDCQPHDPRDRAALVAEFNAARSAEWTEFRSECAKFQTEISKEHRIGKYTLAELDEEEHSLDRLRRWARDIRARDVFTGSEGEQAEKELAGCIDTLEDYANHVYQHAHSETPTTARGGSDA
jgi:hypothetical protein